MHCGACISLIKSACIWFCPEITAPYHSATACPEIIAPYHSSTACPEIIAPYHSSTACPEIIAPYHSATACPEIIAPYHSATACPEIIAPYHSATACPEIIAPYHSATACPETIAPYHLCPDLDYYATNSYTHWIQSLQSEDSAFSHHCLCSVGLWHTLILNCVYACDDDWVNMHSALLKHSNERTMHIIFIIDFFTTNLPLIIGLSDYLNFPRCPSHSMHDT